MRDYADIISQIRIAAIGVKKQSNRLTLMQDAADAIEELIKTSRRWELEAAANEKDKQYLVDENRKLVDSLMNLLVKKWISVEERLPDVAEKVLTYNGDFVSENWLCTVASKDGIKNVWAYSEGFVTHWMPLPEPPKED